MSMSQVRCPAHIRIATRKSQLAVAQALEVKNRILGAFPELTQQQIELVKLDTTGDRIQGKPLSEIGGKGLFTKELEEAMFAGEVDLAVHSMKDMPDTLPEGLTIPCILEREDPRDAFLSPVAKSVEDLPLNAKVGTSSLRRQAQLLKLRPDLTIVPFRGNVNTRLKKLEEGQVDATLLAVAGLKRIELADHITTPLEVDQMLPAVAQGAIGVECCSDNTHMLEVLSVINHTPSFTAVAAERAFLQALNGSCTTPIAGYAEWEGEDSLYFRGLVASPDSAEWFETEKRGSAADMVTLCAEAGEAMLAQAGHVLK